MTDTPAKKEKPVDSLPERPTWTQFREAEMERDTALVSAKRNAEKVEQLRGELKRAADKASREKAKLAGKLRSEVVEWRDIAESAAADLSILQEQIRRDAPFIDVVRTHASKAEATDGCSCPACQVHRTYSTLKDELATVKNKYREAKDTLRTFQGPPSKKKKGKK